MDGAANHIITDKFEFDIDRKPSYMHMGEGSPTTTTTTTNTTTTKDDPRGVIVYQSNRTSYRLHKREPQVATSQPGRLQKNNKEQKTFYGREGRGGGGMGRGWHGKGRRRKSVMRAAIVVLAYKVDGRGTEFTFRLRTSKASTKIAEIAKI